MQEQVKSIGRQILSNIIEKNVLGATFRKKDQAVAIAS